MIKLSHILREIVEGAKVDFKDDQKTPTAIQISQQRVDGEQLQTVDGVRKTDSFSVYYSLESAPDATNIKPAQDALKYNSNLINSGDLKKVIQSSLKGKVAKVDYIGYLESKGELNQKLLELTQQIYPEAKVVKIAKIEYTEIDDAIDWEQFRKESKAIQDSIIAYLYKTAEEDPTYKIRKSGEVQSSIIQRMHSKYDLGLNPNVKNKTLPPIYDVFVDCITKGKKLLIIDDNLHTGTDFLKIFRAVDELSKKMTEEAGKANETEQEAMDTMNQIEQNPKFKTSTFLQDKHKQLKTIVSDYRNRTANITKSYGKARDNVYGYVLYRLKDEDLTK